MEVMVSTRVIMNMGCCYMMRRLCGPTQQPNRTSRQVRPGWWPAYYFLIRALVFVFSIAENFRRNIIFVYIPSEWPCSPPAFMGTSGTVLFYSYRSSSMARIF